MRPGFDPWVRKIPWRRKCIIAWKVLWTEEPGGLQSMGSQDRTQLSAHILNSQDSEVRSAVFKFQLSL